MKLVTVALSMLCSAQCATRAEKPAAKQAPAEQTSGSGAIEATSAPRTRWKIKCHRGASEQAPENTIAAVRLCFESGGLASEVDVRLSSDRVPVVIHDEDTGRVGGVNKKVSEQTSSELAALDVGAWKHPRFRVAAAKEI